jgi:4-hydroxy-tetrahydrodipicolinate reductase
MRIALIGYGKMGKAIEEIAVLRGHTIVAIVNSQQQIEHVDLSQADVAIEFTKPTLALNHISWCLENNLPIIVGTTAWNDQLEEVTKLVHTKNGSVLHASNFSLGVNIFFEINKRLAQLMSGKTDYQACIEEIHHTQKLDAPSGTAISLANDILENNLDYFSWVLGEEQSPHTTEGQLGVTSYRKPDVPGTHTIRYASEEDTITITHEAHSRKGFALGAVIAAEWLRDQKGIFTIKDVLNIQS